MLSGWIQKQGWRTDDKNIIDNFSDCKSYQFSSEVWYEQKVLANSNEIIIYILWIKTGLSLWKGWTGEGNAVDAHALFQLCGSNMVRDQTYMYVYMYIYCTYMYMYMYIGRRRTRHVKQQAGSRIRAGHCHRQSWFDMQADDVRIMHDHEPRKWRGTRKMFMLSQSI